MEYTDVTKYPQGIKTLVEMMKKTEGLSEIAEPEAFLMGLMEFGVKS